MLIAPAKPIITHCCPLLYKTRPFWITSRWHRHIIDIIVSYFSSIPLDPEKYLHVQMTFLLKPKFSIDMVWLVVWTSLKNMSSSDWIIIPTIGEIKNIPNHQPVVDYIPMCIVRSHQAQGSIILSGRDTAQPPRCFWRCWRWSSAIHCRWEWGLASTKTKTYCDLLLASTPWKSSRWKSSCQAEMKRKVKTLPVVWSAAPFYTNMRLPYFQRNPHPASDFLIVSMEINFGIEQDLPTQKLCDITHL